MTASASVGLEVQVFTRLPPLSETLWDAKSSLEPQRVGKTDAEAPRTGMIGVNAAKPEVAAP